MKKSSLTDESLDAKYATSDSFWRKRVMAVYNKSEADFPSLREVSNYVGLAEEGTRPPAPRLTNELRPDLLSFQYNDYLEEVEDIIFCIVNQEPSAASNISSLKKVS